MSDTGSPEPLVFIYFCSELSLFYHLIFNFAFASPTVKKAQNVSFVGPSVHPSVPKISVTLFSAKMHQNDLIFGILLCHDALYVVSVFQT